LNPTYLSFFNSFKKRPFAKADELRHAGLDLGTTNMTRMKEASWYLDQNLAKRND